VDQGIYGHLTRRNLAVLAAERGDYAGVRRLWEEVLAECPGDREALARLGRFREETLTPSPSQCRSRSRVDRRGARNRLNGCFDNSGAQT
jgi:hypothetical protein